MIIHRNAALLIPVLLVLALVASAAAQLVFTAIPDQDDSTLQARASAVTGWLEDYIQTVCDVTVSVTYNPVENYQDAVSALLDGHADFGWYGGLTGVQAGLRSPPAVYIAQRLEDTQFTSVFIQGAGLDLPMGIESANNKSLVFGSASSTSGHLMPQYYMRSAVPPVVPSSTIYTVSHDATVDAVAAGTTQVGTLNSVVWKSRVAANTTGGTSVFYTTPEYVDYLWVAGADIVAKWAGIKGAALVEGCADINTVLTNAFLAANANDQLGEALLTAYSTVGYVPITRGEYDPVEETGCELGMIEEKYCSEPVPDDLGNVGTPTSAPTATDGGPTPAPGGDITSGATEHGASLLSFIVAATIAPFFAVILGL